MDNKEGDFQEWLDDHHPKKKMSFPDGYFSNFPDMIMDKIQEENAETDNKTVEVKPWKILGLSYNKLAIAASLVLVLAAVFLIRNSMDVSVDTGTLVELEDGEYWETMMDYSENITLAELTELDGIDDVLYEMEDELYADNDIELFLEDIDINTFEEIIE